MKSAIRSLNSEVLGILGFHVDTSKDGEQYFINAELRRLTFQYSWKVDVWSEHLLTLFCHYYLCSFYLRDRMR